MSEGEHLADALEGLFENPENGWFMPLVKGIEGLTAQQAATVPAPRFNSVWGVVNHVRMCNEFALHRRQGHPVDVDTSSEAYWWPSPGDPRDERAWQEARDCAIAVNRQVAAYIASMSAEELDQPAGSGPTKRYQLLHGMIGHNSYHACEVITIRHMLGLWLENV